MKKLLINAQIWLNVGNFNEHVYLVPADAQPLTGRLLARGHAHLLAAAAFMVCSYFWPLNLIFALFLIWSEAKIIQHEKWRMPYLHHETITPLLRCFNNYRLIKQKQKRLAANGRIKGGLQLILSQVLRGFTCRTQHFHPKTKLYLSVAE